MVLEEWDHIDKVAVTVRDGNETRSLHGRIQRTFCERHEEAEIAHVQGDVRVREPANTAHEVACPFTSIVFDTKLANEREDGLDILFQLVLLPRREPPTKLFVLFHV